MCSSKKPQSIQARKTCRSSTFLMSSSCPLFRVHRRFSSCCYCSTQCRRSHDTCRCTFLRSSYSSKIWSQTPEIHFTQQRWSLLLQLAFWRQISCLVHQTPMSHFVLLFRLCSTPPANRGMCAIVAPFTSLNSTLSRWYDTTVLCRKQYSRCRFFHARKIQTQRDVVAQHTRTS